MNSKKNTKITRFNKKTFKKGNMNKSVNKRKMKSQIPKSKLIKNLSFSNKKVRRKVRRLTGGATAEECLKSSQDLHEKLEILKAENEIHFQKCPESKRTSNRTSKRTSNPTSNRISNRTSPSYPRPPPKPQHGCNEGTNRCPG